MRSVHFDGIERLWIDEPQNASLSIILSSEFSGISNCWSWIQDEKDLSPISLRCDGINTVWIDEPKNDSASKTSTSESDANWMILIWYEYLNELSLICVITYSCDSWLMERGMQISSCSDRFSIRKAVLSSSLIK